jgi:hypothetical protein
MKKEVSIARNHTDTDQIGFVENRNAPAVRIGGLACRHSEVRLERFQAKWKPVRVKKTRQIKNLEPRFDSIEADKALAGCGCA